MLFLNFLGSVTLTAKKDCVKGSNLSYGMLSEYMNYNIYYSIDDKILNTRFRTLIVLNIV